VFVNAYAATQNKLYKQVAEEIFEFVGRELTSNEGVFYSALDAETNGIEGESYVWEAREIDNVLGPASAAFKDMYHVKDLSDFEHGNVLRLSLNDLPKPAQVLIGDQPDRDEFFRSREKLLEVRNARQQPLRDEKVLTGWNGLMIGSFARAGRVLNQPELVRSAETAAAFVMTRLRDPQGRLLHVYTAGKAKLNAYLDDYAYVIDGLLALQDATGNDKWLTAARQLQDDQLKMFRDEVGGGFYFTSHQHEELLARTKNCYDGVQPAGNSVSARNLIKLAKLTGDQRYLDEARTIVELFASNLDQSPRGLTVLALAASELLDSNKPTGRSQGAPVPQGTPLRDDLAQSSIIGETDKTGADSQIIQVNQKEEAPKNDELVRAQAFLSVDKLPAGSACKLIVLLDVKKGWHINANPPKPDYVKPTKIVWKSKNGLELRDVKYPEGVDFMFKDSKDVVSVYEGEVKIHGTLHIPKEAAGRTEEMEITVHYQACDENGCQSPKTIKLTGKLAIAKQGEVVKPINEKLFGHKVDVGR
jgi:uncharacterized protein